MYDKVYTRVPCDAIVIEDWPNLSGQLIRLPINLPLQCKFITDNKGRSISWVVEEPLGQFLLVSPGPLQDAKDLEQWEKDWQDQKSPQAWFKKDLLRFGYNIHIDWEAGPSLCKENSILLQAILATAQDQIAFTDFSNEDTRSLFNAMVDICLLTLGSGADADSWGYNGAYAEIQNQCLALWSFVMCNTHSKSGIDWYKQDNNTFISNLKPLDDEGE